MSSKALFQALNEVDDQYLDLVDAQEMELKKMGKYQKRPVRRKSITFLIAAAICVSILATTALATGMIPGIFRAMKEQAPQDEALYEAAAQANAESEPESKTIPYLDWSKFTLFERYYDGETILLGYNMDLVLPEPMVGYTPDEEAMRKIKENIKSYYSVGALSDMLSGDALAKALDIMQETGYVCIVTHDVYVGDHIFVNGADIFEVLNEEVWSMRDDYEVAEGSCIRLNPLPDAGRNQDSVTVTLKIKSSEQYWYFDAEGNAMLFQSGNHQEELMDFTLENVNK